MRLVRLVRPEPTPYQRPESSIEVPTGRLARGPGSSSSTCMFRGLSGLHLHQPAATQEVAGHVADHGANGPEVVLAAGLAHRGDGPSSGTISLLVLHGARHGTV